MKIFIILFSSLLLTLTNLQAQDQKKNVFTAQFHVVHGNVSYGGDFNGAGYALNYSRYVGKKLFADIGFGYYQYNGDGNPEIFVDRDTEESLWNMRHIRFGMGYDLMKKNKFTLKGKASVLFLTNQLIDELWYSGDDITLRATKRITDKTIELGLLGDYSLGKGWSGIAELGHGLGLQRYSTTTLKLGVAYSL